jgi:hypothetical protein
MLPIRRLRGLAAALVPTQHQQLAGLNLAPAAVEADTTTTEPTASQRWLFDLQGFVLLRGVLSGAECASLRSRLYELEAVDYPDRWIEELGLERCKVAHTKQSSSRDLQGMDGQTRLNGLPKIDNTGTFDHLIDHPRITPFLSAFIGGGYGQREQQLVNIWSITKSKGSGGGGYHSGLGPGGYSIDPNSGMICSQMLNVVWMLTDNGIADGCMTVIPGVSILSACWAEGCC